MKKLIFTAIFAMVAFTAIHAQTKADTIFDKSVSVAQEVSPNVHVDTLNNLGDLINAVKELKDAAPTKTSSVEQIIGFSFLVLALVLGVIQFFLHHNIKKEFAALKQKQ